MSDPAYDLIAPGLLPETTTGYFSLDNEQGLAAILKDRRLPKVVEVGSYQGASARFIGRILKEKLGKLWCVDPWSGYDQLHVDRPWDEIYRQFLSNMIHAGLRDTVIPVRAKSVEAAPLFEDGSLSVVYVDGYHSREAVREDVCAWWPKLRNGGIMCGDDITWEGVSDGLADACELTGARMDEAHMKLNQPHFWKMEPKR